MILSDFHMHSTFSDGSLTIAELVDLYGKKGFDAIAITDHLCDDNTFLGKAAHILDRSLNQYNFQNYLNEMWVQAKRAKAEYDMVLIPGIEITKNSFVHANSAHILALGISSWVDPNSSIVEICQQIKMQGAVSIAAHPVSTKKIEPQTYHLWNHRSYFCNHFDAWEVASGPHIFEQVANTHLPMIANSDLHNPTQFSSWKTEVKSSKTQMDILTAIKKQNLKFKFIH